MLATCGLLLLSCPALVLRPVPGALRSGASLRKGVPAMSSGDALRTEIAAKKQAAGDASVLSDSELELALSSLQEAGSATHALDWPGLRALLARAAHLPHKDWARTEVWTNPNTNPNPNPNTNPNTDACALHSPQRGTRATCVVSDRNWAHS